MSKEESGGGPPQEGGDASKKDDIYENRNKKTIIRLVTVVAYMFSVSFVAIVLSAYYLFLWEPPNPRNLKKPGPLSSEPELEFLQSDPLFMDYVLDEPKKISLIGRVSETDDFNNYDHETKHRKKLNETLFLLKNSLAEWLRNKIDDSKSSKSDDHASLENKEAEKRKIAKHSSEIINRGTSGNNGTVLESSTISGDEASNDRFTSTRHESSETATKSALVDREKYKNSKFPSDFQETKMSRNDGKFTIKENLDKTGNNSNNNQSTNSFRNLEFVNGRKYSEQSKQSHGKPANAALKFEETQIEEMTKSIALTNEQTILPKLTTTQQQKDVLTFLIEIANASSTSASILTTLEDSQTDSNIEIKETSSNILNSKIK